LGLSVDFLNWVIVLAGVVSRDISNKKANPESTEGAYPGMDGRSVNVSETIKSFWEGEVSSEPECGGDQES